MHRPDRPPPVHIELLRLATPFALGNALNVFHLVLDRMWIGRGGTEALAALGAAQSVLALLGTLFLGLGMGTLAGVARSVGAGRPREAAEHLAQGLVIALGLGLACAVAATALPPGYLRVGLVGTLFQAPLLVLVFALQGAGEARTALRVGAASPLLNAVLDPLLIVGCGMGLVGAAWAALLANGLALLLGLAAVRSLGARLPLSLDLLAPRRRLLSWIAARGAPGTFEHLVRATAAFALVTLVSPFGPAPLAAYTAVLALLMVVIFPGLALGQATASLVGRHLGARDPARAWTTAWVAAGLYAAAMSLAGLVAWHAGGRWVAFFDPRVAAEGAALLRYLAPALPFLGLALVLGKAMSGAGRPLPALASAVGAHLLVQIPLVVVLLRAWGPEGAWAGMATAFVVQGSLTSWLFLRCCGAPELGPVALPWPRPALVRVAAAALLVTCLTSCQAVDFTERRDLADPIMELDDGPAETHFTQKTRYSREGSAGGIGGSAGGGCGCY